MKISINRNILWADKAVNQLWENGLEHVCISPGSRNTPLILAFQASKKIKKHVIIDERTSGFFALGIAKRIKQPVAIVTTSGTAVAELYPAIIEAYQTRIPLIICTADRPAYLRNSGANQTINQNNIYKNHIRGFFDLGLPQIKMNEFKQMCQTVSYSFQLASQINIGPVHLNFPFKKPLELDNFTDNINVGFLNNLQRIKIGSLKKRKNTKNTIVNNIPGSLINRIEKSKRGIIFCGPGFYTNNFIKKCIRLSKLTNFPIIADGASNFRFSTSSSQLISDASSFLRERKIRNYLDADIIIQFGKAPTSQSLLDYFSESNGNKYIINQYGDLHDPSERRGKIIKIGNEQFCDLLLNEELNIRSVVLKKEYKKNIMNINSLTQSIKSNIIDDAPFPFEGRIICEVIKSLNQRINLIVSNSTPVRDLDNFASSSGAKIDLYTNRGASGIDGVTSTSLGIAAVSKNPTILVTGDLAFFHDLNGLAISQSYSIPLVVILINNNGGGIFELLPISKNKNIFNDYFKTPHKIKFNLSTKAFGGNFIKIRGWSDLRKNLQKAIGERKLTILEIITDSTSSTKIKKQFWKSVTTQVSDFLLQ